MPNWNCYFFSWRVCNPWPPPSDLWPLPVPVGDQGDRGGLPPAGPHGLSRGAAPAHAGLLGEGSQREAQVWPDRHHAGQADQKPSQPQRAGQQLRVSWTQIINNQNRDISFTWGRIAKGCLTPQPWKFWVQTPLSQPPTFPIMTLIMLSTKLLHSNTSAIDHLFEI